MADPTPLSPAAQAVLDAAFGRWMEIDDIDDDIPGKIAVAALRAAAAIEIHNPWGGRIESAGSMWMRDQILAIATELENHQ